MRKHRTTCAFVIVVLLGACARTPPAAIDLEHGALRGRDMLLITLDTTRRDHLGCYGGSASATPALDQLCAAGLRLDRAVAVAPITLPAHASLFTGLYPPHHGARYNGEFRLGPEFDTLAERLQHAGYATAGFVSAFVLDRRFGLDQGFDHYDDSVAALDGAFSSSGNERSAEQVTDAALAYLAQRDPDKPLLLWVHYFDAHAPYVAPELASGASDAHRYAAEISRIDAQIARLLEAPTLRWRDGLTMVLADHGESLGEHGERTHGLFVYDSTIAIPWIVAAPGLQAGRSDALVSQVDALPTALDLLGLPQAAKTDGRSLLDPPRAPDDDVAIETTLPYFDFRLAPLQALRTASAKYIHAPRPEFYRLDRDPHELDDLLAEAVYPADATILAERMDALRAAWPDVISATRSTLDADTEMRLRSLGYLSGSDQGLDLADPKDAVVLVREHQLAAEAASAGDAARAIAHLDTALASVPQARGALYLRARLLAASNRRAEAERDILAVNAQRPNADSLLLQAQLWVLGDRRDDARLLLDEAARLEPEHGGVLVVRGDLAVLEQDIPAARAAYRAALALDGKRIGRQAETRLRRLPAE